MDASEVVTHIFQNKEDIAGKVSNIEVQNGLSLESVQGVQEEIDRQSAHGVSVSIRVWKNMMRNRLKKVHRVSKFILSKVYKLLVENSVTNYVGVEMYDRVPWKSAFVRILMCNRVINLTQQIVKTYDKVPREMVIIRLKVCNRVIKFK